MSDSTMRVLYIIHSSAMGGATISFLNLIMGLKDKGVEPHVIVNKDIVNEEFNSILERNAIPYYEAGIVTSVIPRIHSPRGVASFIKKRLLFPFKIRRSRKDIGRIVNIVKPDIIHTNTGVVHEGYWVAKKLHIPHVWHLREYQTKDFDWMIYPSYRRFCSDLLNSYVITITDGIKSYFRLDKSSKAITIYNGIFSNKKVFPRVEKEDCFLLCSRITKEKGHEDAIRAFGNFSKNKSYRLVIAGFGDESYQRWLMDLAGSLNCSDRIEFIGFRNDVTDIMSRAKALLVPSFYEGFGRMTAEAAFCGTLVIGRNTGGTKEILDKTGGGYLFSTVAELTDMMETVAVLSPEDYSGIVESARQIARDNYCVEGNVSNTLAYYSFILDAGRK